MSARRDDGNAVVRRVGDGWRVFHGYLPGFGQQSLMGRLLSLLLVGALASYVVVNAGLWLTATRLITDSLEKQAGQWMVELDQLSVPLYASRGSAAGERIKIYLDKNPEILFVRYYDATGSKVIAQYGVGQAIPSPLLTREQFAEMRARQESGSSPHLHERSLFGKAQMRVATPIVVRSMRSDSLLNFRLGADHAEKIRVVGFVEMNVSIAQQRGQLLAGMLRASLVIALLFLASLLVGRHLIRRALAPLTNLQEPLRRLAEGDIDVTVAKGGDREIAVIGEALNTTIRAIRERDSTLRRIADSDPLTGLPNRAAFVRALEGEIARATHEATSSAVFFVDLDQFKCVNDTLGHAAGDRLLLKVADVLKSRMRDSDVVSRFGGDEFTVLARGVNQDSAIELATSINELMREIHLVEGEQTFTVNCSIGITVVTSDRFSVDEVLSQADQACYEAKTRGRNRFHAYEFGVEDRKKIMSDMNWAQQIRNALSENRFRLAYQPIRRVTSTVCDFYEVLLRLPGHDGDLIAPGAFLPVAQRFGLLADIDRWVIRQAFETLAEVRRSGREMRFSINLSGQTLEDTGLYEVIREGLQAGNLPPGAVVFEVTEQTAVRNMGKASHLIERLSALGCQFALDDFGKGFSSFTHLKHLPVHFIKIDGSFIENLLTNPVDQAMVTAIIQVARALGKQTIAEFVQDEGTIDLLRQAGVDFVQGYHVDCTGPYLLPPVLRAVAG